MRNLKKMLSLVMALAMIASFMVVGASAADFSDVKGIKNVDAVNTLVALNIIKGYDTGDFKPEGIVTRAEMAKMICVTLNGGNDPKLGNTTSKFTDVPATHWASGYIDFCNNMGMIAGYENGTFKPDATVTGVEAAKMLLTLIGYDAANSKLVGAQWDINTNAQANLRGFYTDLAINPSKGLTRDNAAQMIFNAVQATTVKYDYKLTTVDGQVTTLPVVIDATGTILSNKFKTTDPAPEGVLSSFTYNTTTKKYTYTVTGEGTFSTKSDFTALMGQNVRVIAKSSTDKTVYGIFSADSSVIATGYVGDIGDLNATNKTLKVAGTAYDVASTTIPVVTYKDGASVGTLTAVQAAAAAATSPYSFKLIDNTGDDKADIMVVTPFSVAKVTYVGTDSITFDNGIGNVDKEDVTYYDGIVKGDYVSYTNGSYVSANNNAAIEKIALSSATVTGSKSSKWLVDGIWMTDKSSNITKVNDVIDYIAFGGVIYYAKVTSGATGSKDLAMLLNAAVSTNATGSTHQAQLLFADGSKKLVDTTADYYTSNTLIGKVVTYSVNNDGEYTLTALHNTSNKAGYDTYANSDAYNNGKIATYTLADNAVVFVFVSAKGDDVAVVATGNSGKVFSGKEVKNSYTGAFTGHLGTGSSTNVAAYVNDQALIGKTNGFSYTQVAGICVATGTSVGITSGDNYGYLTADAYKTVEKDANYLNFTLWTANGKLETKWKTDTSETSYTAGNLIAYDTDGTDIKNVSAVITMTTAAVVGYNQKTQLQFVTAPGGNATPEKIDDDTVILYVNTADHTGVSGGEIDFAAEPVANNYLYNVAYPTSSGALLKLLVVDVNNKWTDSANAATTYTINDTIATVSGLTVDKVTALAESSFAVTSARVGTTVTVPVTVTASAATTAPVIVTATITVAGGSTITATHTCATGFTSGDINLTFTMPYGNVTGIVLSAKLA